VIVSVYPMRAVIVVAGRTVHVTVSVIVAIVVILIVLRHHSSRTRR
jgi:hypothetical protein